MCFFQVNPHFLETKCPDSTHVLGLRDASAQDLFNLQLVQQFCRNLRPSGCHLEESLAMSFYSSVGNPIVNLRLGMLCI